MVPKGNWQEVRDEGDGSSRALKESEIDSMKSKKVVGEVAACGWNETSRGWKGKVPVREGTACSNGVSDRSAGLCRNSDVAGVAKRSLGSGLG